MLWQHVKHRLKDVGAKFTAHGIHVTLYASVEHFLINVLMCAPLSYFWAALEIISFPNANRGTYNCCSPQDHVISKIKGEVSNVLTVTNE